MSDFNFRLGELSPAQRGTVRCSAGRACPHQQRVAAPWNPRRSTWEAPPASCVLLSDFLPHIAGAPFPSTRRRPLCAGCAQSAAAVHGIRWSERYGGDALAGAQDGAA